jgi:hypothetical protein
MNRSLPWLVFVTLAACGPRVPADEAGGGRLADVGAGGAGDEGGGAGGVGGDVGRAIDDAKVGLAELDAKISAARTAIADGKQDDPAADELAVELEHDRIAMQSYLAHLERCATDAEACPPSLVEPAVPSEYDPASGELKGAFAAEASRWPAAAKQIAADACACRTYVCVGWVLAELDRWQRALSATDLDTDDAAVHETMARECVHARLGDR